MIEFVVFEVEFRGKQRDIDDAKPDIVWMMDKWSAEDVGMWTMMEPGEKDEKKNEDAVLIGFKTWNSRPLKTLHNFSEKHPFLEVIVRSFAKGDETYEETILKQGKAVLDKTFERKNNSIAERMVTRLLDPMRSDWK